ncbi:MAG: hypothetical protein ACRCSU_13125 [Paracoccaceae bacterium]
MRFSIPSFLLAVMVAAAATAAHADTVTDALDAARAAYDAGDLRGALASATEATKAMQGQQTEAFAAFLPDAPDGWTKTINPDMAAGMAMIGGGAGVEATYESPEKSFTVTLIADSPMIESMLPMFTDKATMAMMGTVTELAGQSFIGSGETEAMTVIGNKIMLTASGADISAMTPVLETIDYAGLSALVGAK